MAINIDLKTIADTNFDKFLNRNPFGNAGYVPRYSSAVDIAGGTLGDGTVINLGSKYIKIDGKNRRIIINDGTYDRVLIGYQKNGF